MEASHIHGHRYRQAVSRKRVTTPFQSRFLDRLREGTKTNAALPASVALG
jgi:hypothetical protein